MPLKKHYSTIKEAASDLLMEVSYTDIHGRKVGLTYSVILKRLHEIFPNGSPNWPGYRTSLGSLRKIAYAMNGSEQRMPVRRRSEKILARDYARALLIQRDDAGMGLSLRAISRAVKKKFPSYPIVPRQLKSLAVYMKYQFLLPPRPEAS
jgi:hypothetical protein